MGLLGALWGLGGFSLILGYAIVRLAPIGIDAFSHQFRWYHWVALAVTTFFMAYWEGYRGFQKGLSPRVAARAKHMNNHPRLLHILLGPFYCLGYFHSSTKRKIVAYSLTTTIIILVSLVRHLDQPWRGIIDIGVVVGLSWGLVSLFVFSIQAFTSNEFNHSPEVPEP